MKKPIFLTLLTLSSISFGATIKRNDLLICHISNDKFQIGHVSALYKDGTVQLENPYNADAMGRLTPADSPARINAKKCKQIEAGDEESPNKPVICEIPWRSLKVSGVVMAPFKDYYLIKASGVSNEQGDFDSINTDMIVQKVGCSIDETVDELNVSDISREQVKEISGIQVRINETKTSNQ